MWIIDKTISVKLGAPENVHQRGKQLLMEFDWPSVWIDIGL